MDFCESMQALASPIFCRAMGELRCICQETHGFVQVMWENLVSRRFKLLGNNESAYHASGRMRQPSQAILIQTATPIEKSHMMLSQNAGWSKSSKIRWSLYGPHPLLRNSQLKFSWFYLSTPGCGCPQLHRTTPPHSKLSHAGKAGCGMLSHWQCHEWLSWRLMPGKGVPLENWLTTSYNQLKMVLFGGSMAEFQVNSSKEHGCLLLNNCSQEKWDKSKRFLQNTGQTRMIIPFWDILRLCLLLTIINHIITIYIYILYISLLILY